MENKVYQSALIGTNTAYLLADVIDSFMLDVECCLSELGSEIKHGERKQFKILQSEAKALHERAKRISAPIYRLKQTDAAVEDSDWFYDIIRLLIDRIGDNDQKAEKIKEMILEIESELNYY